MIPRECRRLAEVDFPIGVVSKHSVREKSIRHGHPSTLHLWWARRPLAACRSMLLALLLPDPCDVACPADFKTKARTALAGFYRLGAGDEALRAALLRFVGEVANWDVAGDKKWIEMARALVRAAHDEGDPPLVVDPFAGGGAIPLEALRLGCDAFASDLNPVACLILKTMLEDIPRHGPGLADEVRKAGAEIKAAAEKELAQFYPPDPDGSRPIAYLWARTVRCEQAGCGAEIPLVRSLWLCKKANRRRALRPIATRQPGELPSIGIEIISPARESDVPRGTVDHARATCVACGTVVPPDRVRAQLREQQGGAEVVLDSNGQRKGGARLVAVVTLNAGFEGRQYRAAGERDYAPLRRACAALGRLASDKLENGLPLVPTEEVVQTRMAKNSPFRFHLYGCLTFGNLCTARQKLGLLALARLIRAAQVGDATKALLGLAFDKVASRSSSLSSWRYQADQEKVEHMFVRQALSLEWDFAESVPLSESTGSFSDGIEVVAKAVEKAERAFDRRGESAQADAAQSPLAAGSSSVWFSDPPYYDAVPYSDLSDYFYVWLRRALPDGLLRRDPDDPLNPLTPKRRETRMDESREVDGVRKDGAFFEALMAKAFREGRRVLHDDGIGSVVFAHKTTAGWEALLSGMIKGGWVITGSWPIATEMRTRLRARDSAALATSVHLVCRPRPDEAPVGDWAEVLRELPVRVRAWMDRLAKEGIHGADLVFACIGPAMEIYSRYRRVEDAEGREIPLGGSPDAKEAHKRGFLAYVWETVGRLALEQVLGSAEANARNGAAGAIEEDARLTALFLWTQRSSAADADAGGVKSEQDDHAGDDEGDDEADEAPSRAKKKGLRLPFDVVRRFAQPLGIRLEGWEKRIIDTDKGVVRLLPVDERAPQLFGDDGAAAVARRIELAAEGPRQADLFPNLAAAPTVKSKAKGRKRTDALVAAASAPDPAAKAEASTLDRVHAAMLLQASGRTNALRALLAAEQARGPFFLRLANALAALYPDGTDERRLVQAMLLAVPRR